MRSVQIVGLVLAATLLGGTPGRAEPEPPVEPRARSAAQALVEALRQVVLVAPLTARVESVAVDVGDRVQAGQPLVRLDRRALELAVKQTELGVASQQVALDVLAVRQKQQEALLASIADDLKRVRALVASAMAGPEDVADVEAAHAQAQAERDVLALEVRRERVELERQELARRAALLDLEQAEIRAPFDGVVAALSVSAGDTVRALESPVVTVLDPDRVCVVAEVPAAQADHWAAGTAVRVTARLDGKEHVLPARVERVAPTVDVERQWVSVRLALVEPPSVRLRPGLAVRADLVLGGR